MKAVKLSLCSTRPWFFCFHTSGFQFLLKVKVELPPSAAMSGQFFSLRGLQLVLVCAQAVVGSRAPAKRAAAERATEYMAEVQNSTVDTDGDGRGKERVRVRGQTHLGVELEWKCLRSDWVSGEWVNECVVVRGPVGESRGKDGGRVQGWVLKCAVLAGEAPGARGADFRRHASLARVKPGHWQTAPIARNNP